MGLNIKIHGKSIQLILEQDGVNLSVIYRWSLHPWLLRIRRPATHGLCSPVVLLLGNIQV